MNERSPDKNASDFLLELRSEEIPARMQAPWRTELCEVRVILMVLMASSSPFSTFTLA